MNLKQSKTKKGVKVMTQSYTSKAKMFQILNTIGFIVTIIVNGLANALPINGQTTGEVSDSYPNLFAPAPITFAIWGVIYVALGVFIIYQLGLFSKGRKDHLDIVTRIGWSFVIASVANSAWIFAWHYNQILISVLLMLILLTSLIDIYEKVNKGKPRAMLEKIAVKWPFSIYLSWISVATIANITTFLVSIYWNGLGITKPAWTMIVILIATIITLRFIFYKRDIPYALVTLWAFAGIIIKHVTFFAGQYREIIIITAFCMLIIAASIFAMPKAYETQRS